MKNILVTGAGGFMGKHVVRALIDNKDVHLILIDHHNTDVDFSGYPKSRSKSLRFYNVDIRNRDAVFDMFSNEKIDTCIHLAAKVNVQDSINYPDRTMDVNVNGTINMLEACSYSHVDNFVFASSAAVYGHPAKLPITEEDELSPISPYGTSKLLAEQHVLSYMKSKKIPNTISLRIFNAYGEGQFGNENVMTTFAKRLSNGLAPIIYGDGMRIRDFISVSDVANAISLSIKAMDEGDEKLLSTPSWIFNIGTGIGTSIKDLCEEMISFSGLDLKPIYQETNNKGDIKASCADITKSKNALKFVPKNTLKIDLKNLVTSMISTHAK
jgi:UDP-glucose 4-epimerase